MSIVRNTVVVVGASTGLGRATARALARDHRVIVAGRNVEQLRAAVPGAEAMHVDLADLRSVEAFTRELRGPIAGIACNAGIQDTGQPVFTADGHERTFAVNHLAHFAVVLGAMQALTPGARIAFIGSGTLDPDDRGARRFGFRGGRYTDARSLARGDGDPAADIAQRARDRYATSKQCNLLAMRALARRAPHLGVFALDPGLMPGTGLARDRSAVERMLWHTVMRGVGLVMPRASSARRSGAALAWILTDPSLAGTTGRYFDFRRRELEPCADARRDDLAAELYATSLELCGFERDPLVAAA